MTGVGGRLATVADHEDGCAGRRYVTRKFHVARRHYGRKQFRDGSAPDVPAGRIPRIARLMALAIRCDQLIRDGIVANQSELARFGHVTTARMTQIMTLLNLSPDIQEHILFLPRVERGRDPIIENEVRPIAQTFDWNKQRRLWSNLQRSVEQTKVSSR